MKKNEVDIKKIKKKYKVAIWKMRDIAEIHDRLEKPNWAPWLCFSKEGMAQMCSIFPEGQLVVKGKDGESLAYISANRVNWNGRIKDLPTWDSVAGDQVSTASYKKTYIPNGNTIVIMCLTVGSKHQGKYLPTVLMHAIANVARRLRVNYVISPFRPSSYGEYKHNHGYISIEKYCKLKRPDGLPVDPWLRNVVRNGIKPLTVRNNSIVVKVPKAVFEFYKVSYKQDYWRETHRNVWECQETGRWYASKSEAVYREAEMWGLMPL